jgi:hypothetical protein
VRSSRPEGEGLASGEALASGEGLESGVLLAAGTAGWLERFALGTAAVATATAVMTRRATSPKARPPIRFLMSSFSSGEMGTTLTLAAGPPSPRQPRVKPRQRLHWRGIGPATVAAREHV